MKRLLLALVMGLYACSLSQAGEPIDSSFRMFGTPKKSVTESLFKAMFGEAKHACDCGPGCQCGDDCKCGEKEEATPIDGYIDVMDELFEDKVNDLLLVRQDCPGGVCPTNGITFTQCPGGVCPTAPSGPGMTVTVPAMNGAPVSSGGSGSYTGRIRFRPARFAARVFLRPFARVRARRGGC